jgi:hypothetical protein
MGDDTHTSAPVEIDFPQIPEEPQAIDILIKK